MIPATYPSILDSSNRTKMLVYQVPSITGLTRWIDYIPVKSPTSESDLTLANTFANEGFILTFKVNDITGLVPFKDYVPIYLDSTATKAWSADNDGYIPMAELAGLLLDFTTGSLDSWINFTRTTNATVTNSAGQITYAPHNLLTYSEQFDNAAWLKLNYTVSANDAVAPNSYQTADTITTTGGGGNIYQASSVTAGLVYTFSFYAKRGTATDAKYSIFNVTGATDIVAATSYYSSINSDTWTRVTVTFTAPVGCTSVRSYFMRDNNAAGTTFIWGAQLEIGSTATTYNSTTVKNLLGFSELFDNAAWTKSNSFVQTNLLTYSEDYSQTAWSKSETTISANIVNAPNGYQTADKLIESTANAAHAISENITLTINNTYTQTYYVKPAGRTKIQLRRGLAGALPTPPTALVFDLTAGTYSGSLASGWTNPTITAVNDGWFKITITVTATATGSDAVGLYLCDSSGAFTYTGDGSSGIYIWGAQLVQGSVAGDYRRTDSTSLPVYYANHNGVVCAEQLHGTAANGTILESYTATGGSMTFSLWMRRITGAGNVDITMDTGVTWTTQAITTSWARYSVTSTPTAGARTAGIRLVTSGDVIQVFGGMVSDSASLDPYVLNAAAAPTAAAYYGARFDYDPVTLAPKGLLIEEQRSNLLLNSTLPATNLATQNVTVTAVAHTLSFYGTGNIVLSGTASATLTGTGAYPTRSTLTFTPTAGTLTLTVTGTVQYAQLEIGAFATSFIPTAASQVTRVADSTTIQGSNFYSWYNQNEGSVVTNLEVFSTSTNMEMTFSDGTANNRIMLGTQTGNSYRPFIAFNNTTQSSLNPGTYSANVFSKLAVGYKINDIASSINNSTVVTDSSAEIPIVNRYNINTAAAGTSGYISGHIKQISYYPQRLSDSVLKGLTA